MVKFFSENALNDPLNVSASGTATIDLEQLHEAGKKIKLVILVNLVMAFLVLLILWNSVPATIMTSWIAVFALSIFFKVVLALYYQKAQIETLTRWKSYFIFASLFSGILWGTCGLLIETYTLDIQHGIEAFVLGGLAAGAIATNTQVKWSYPAFMVPMLSILMINFILHWDTSHFIMAGMIFFFIIVLSIFSVNFRQLQFEKHRLLFVTNVALDRLKESEKHLKDITTSMGEGLFVMDKTGSLLFINPEGERLLGWSFNELQEDTEIIKNKIYADTLTYPYNSLIKQVTANGGKYQSHNEELKRKDGKIFPVSLTAASLHSPDGATDGTVVVFQDITKQKELEKRLESLAVHDTLTGLYNRGHFDNKLNDELIRTQRYYKSLSLLMIDIDFFKKVNDAYGHQAGDEVLQCVANLISSSVRNSDYIARYGGEEFVIILPETDIDQAMELAERIRANVEKTSCRLSKNGTVHVTISIGVSTSSRESSPSLLVEAADNGLYKAKASGRNQIGIME